MLLELLPGIPVPESICPIQESENVLKSELCQAIGADVPFGTAVATLYVTTLLKWPWSLQLDATGADWQKEGR